jgi:diguanylate cyclase (GGDEF)-like protein
MRIRLELFDSGIARRIFGLFLVASLVPLFMLAVWLLQRVGGELERHADEELATAARSYGRLTLEKLLAITAVLPSPESLRASGDVPLPAELAAAAIVRHGRAEVRFGDWRELPAGIEVDASKPTVALAPGPGGYDVIIARGTDEEAVFARLEPDYLWQTREALARGMEVCVLGPSNLAAPAQCSAPLDRGVLATLQAARRSATSGELAWSETDGDDWLSAYWELFMPSRFTAQPWTIVVSQPRSIALGSLASVYRVAGQAAVLTLALIVLLAGAQIRRTLQPLQELLKGTRRIAAQDFETPVNIAAGDEFGDVGQAMNAMAARLNHQFASLRALADIDRLILETAAIETVLETLLTRLRILVPHGEYLVLMIDIADHEHGRVYRARGTDRIVLDRVTVSAQLRGWLASEAPAYASTAAQLPSHDVALGAWPPEATSYVAPLLVGDTVAGALLAIDRDGAPFTDRERHSIHELAVRVAVAVAASDREAELFRRAHFDPLTGLPNRELLDDRLQQAVAQAHRDERRLAVLFIDLDGFKEVNDTLGHRSGDELLKETGLRLSAVLRDADTVARLGGDEYAIVLPQVHGPLEAEAVAIKAIEGLKHPFVVDGREVFVGASVGIALFPDDGGTAEELLRRADMAMYGAKDAGKSCYRFFAREMDEQIQERHSLHHALRHALDEEQFFLAYQPQRELETRRVTSVEALLRWRHPQRGLVSPALFVPILEETGLINEVGTWVLRTALRDLATWRSLGLPIERVAVNVSVRQLQDPGFADSVIEHVAAAGLEGHHLEVEITEASVVADFHVTNDALRRLGGHGIRVALDDFGTGYSSLAYLNELVFDTLKIDRAFVINLPAEKSVAIVKAIIAVAATLGKKVVAEGIETEPQYRKLAALGCDIGQGFLLCRPLDAPAFVSWMSELLAPVPIAVGDSTSRIWRPNFGRKL